MRNVCIYGASSTRLQQIYYDVAFEMGQKLAQNGIGMVFGAGRIGIMGAAARGAMQQNGRILGVIPHKLNVEGVVFEGCTELFVTETMHERKSKMEELSGGFIALPGGYGTLEELLEVLTLKQLGYHAHPIVVLNINGFFDDLLKMFERASAENFMDSAYLRLFYVAGSPDDAIGYLKNYTAESMPDKMQNELNNQ